MKKMLPVCGYAVSALLFLSYVMILGTSLFPKVCAEYRLYYIERELQDWPGYGGLQYRLGTPVVFRSTEEDRTRRCGNSWNSFEEDGCWTYGGHSALYFSGIFQNPGKEDGGAGNAGEEEKKRYVEIDVQEVREGAVSQVCANGEPIGQIASAGTFRFEFPQDMPEGDILLLEFFTDGFGPVGEDARSQGIKVREIIIDDAVE